MDNIEEVAETRKEESVLIFMGTGCSSCVPSGRCLIQPSDPPCPVCSQSLVIPPHLNPNYRCNTSLLVDYCLENGEHTYILIDVGKTFREQMLRWFLLHHIPRTDSILLTHDHADAVLGLDDLFCLLLSGNAIETTPIPIYATQDCINSVISRFPYLSKRPKEGEVTKQVGQVDWKIIEENCDKPFVASGLQFYPLPVMHGEDYVALGFLFGHKSRIAYISDVSRFPSSTEYVISKSGGGQLDLLILDSNSIRLTGSRNTHLCFPESLDAVKRLCPKRALLTGLTHSYDHHLVNEFLSQWSEREGISVQLAHDGLRIPIDL